MPRQAERLQWIRYECGAGLGDLLRVSSAGELAHRRLSEFHWHSGEWPTNCAASAGTLGRVSRQRWETVLADLIELGWRNRRGFLYHPGVAAVRRRAIAALELSRAGGRAAAARKTGNGGPGGGPAGAPGGGPNAPPAAAGDPMPVRVKSKSTSTKALNAERLTRSVSPPEKCSQAEQAFMASLREALAVCGPGPADLELENWGGWWRNRYRENPDKTRRILAEVASMLREGRILKNPGAAALDLWGRLP